MMPRLSFFQRYQALGACVKRSFAVPGVDNNPTIPVRLWLVSSPPPHGCYKASAAQPHSPTWTAHDGYGSEATTVTAASGQSRIDPPQHHLAPDAYPGTQPSSRRRVQQLNTNTGRVPGAIPGDRYHTRGATRLPATERKGRKQDWDEQRESQRGGDVSGAQTEGGFSCGGGVRAGRNR